MIDMHSPYCCYVTGVVFYTCCDVYYALLTLKVPKEQMKKFMSAKLKKKKYCPGYVILRIQRKNIKQCRFR